MRRKTAPNSVFVQWNISYAPAADITSDFFSSFENRMRVFTWHVWLLQGPLEVSITSLLEHSVVKPTKIQI